MSHRNPDWVVADDSNALTGESPCWDSRTATLWWIDIQGQRLLSLQPENGHKAFWNLPSMPGLIALRARGELLVGLEDGFYGFETSAGLGRRLAMAPTTDGRTRLNDGKADRRGRLWFGSMDKTGS